ncbi:MAG: glycosyl hydrolase family 28 protein [Bryobacteraceae bacterium]|jgi:polygalacturonase
MTYKFSLTLAGLALIAAAAPAPQRAATSQGEITAALPVIPSAKFNLLDYGAKGDGRSLNTEAFKSAVAAIAKAGGGHLIVPAGTFKTLPFALTSHMDLHLEAGAIIKAPDTFEEYGIPNPNLPRPAQATPPAGGRGGFGRIAPLITCPSGTTDLAITGSGTIDGSGAMFWMWSDKAARRYPPGRAVVPRPVLVSLVGVERLHVDGITLTNSPSFHLAPSGQDITLENLRIVAPSDGPNTDAMDPGGERIVIRKCEIDVGDDNVAMKNGGKDVLMEDLTCFHGHGISIGSATRGGFSHIVVRRCTFNGTDNGLRIKSFRGGGGEVHDIRFSDIVMKDVRRPVDINMLYNGNAGLATDVGPRQAAPGETQYIPNFHDIHITNLTVTRSPVAGRILGLPEQLANAITFTNVSFQSTRGFLVQDGKDIVFEKAKFDVAMGEALVLDNGSVRWNGTQKSGTSGGPPDPFY